MKKFRKAQCPYCGRKVSLLSTCFLRTQGEYKCPKCGGFSNIQLDGAAILFGFLAIFISGIFFVVQYFYIKTFNWQILFFVIFPFVLFYIFSIFLVRLRKPVMQNRAPDGTQRARPIRTHQPNPENTENNNVEHTVVMDHVKTR